MDIDSLMEQSSLLLSSVPFHLVIVCFAVCGLVLIGILTAQAFQRKHDKTDRHRSGNPGVADLLNWAALVEDGIVLNKNGSLMAAWVYRGGDNASSANADRNAVSQWINAAIKQLGSGWMFHVDAIRRPCPSYSDRAFSHFPDPVSAALDEERRQFFAGRDTLYEGCFVLVVTYFPPVLAQAKFVELMFDDDVKSEDDKNRGQKIIDDFKRQVDTLESRLSSAFQMLRLRSVKVESEDGAEQTHDEFLRWLHYCLTGINQPIFLPSNPFYIDCLIGGQDMIAGMIPIIGDNYVMVVAIDNFPMETMPAMLNGLAELPVEYRWNTRFIFLDQHESVAHIEKYRRKWRQKVRGIKDQIFKTNSGSVNQDALMMVQDCDLALLETNGGFVGMGYYSSNIILMGPDREALHNAALFVQKWCGNLGFPARIEDVNAMDAFIGSLPGHGVQNIRRAMMNTRNFADLIPSSSIWTGEDVCPCEFYPPMSPALAHCVTTGYSPFRLNVHVRDLGHTIIFGPTGAGKSVLLAFLASQFMRYKGMTVFAFDKGMSQYALCRAVGGQHYNIGGDDHFDEEGRRVTNLAFCPLQFLETQSDRTWAASWIETLCSLNGLELKPEQRNEIAACIELMEANNQRMGQRVLKTLLDFYTSLQDREIQSALKMYTTEGPMGYMLDAKEDQLGLSAGGMTVFEIEELMGMGNAKYSLPVLLYLFRRIEKSLTGQPAVIILDEAWLMLAHEVFREKIREWFKVLRKANCSVILATQSLSDAVGSGILDVIRESTATKIFLPNSHAKGADTADVYRAMGLNSQQINIISSAIPKRQYYYTSENGNRLFELALGPLALSLLAVSDKDSVATIKGLEAQFGDRWRQEWFKLRGLNENIVEKILAQ